jgi:hypothetical protein
MIDVYHVYILYSFCSVSDLLWIAVNVPGNREVFESHVEVVNAD